MIRHAFLTISALLLLTSCDKLPQPDSPEGTTAASDATTSLQMAKSLQNSGNLSGAAHVYHELTQRPDAPLEAYVELAGLMRKANQPKEAVSLLRQAQAKSPADVKIIARLGQALIAAGQPEEAVNVYDQLIAMQPKDAMAYNGKAVAFDSAGNHVAAQEIYQKALSLAPESNAIRNNAAMSFILNDQYDEAIALLTPMVNEPGATPAMRHNLALAYGLKGDKKQALAALGDMPPEKAQENLRFYSRYAKMKKEKKPADLVNEMQPILSGPETPSKPVLLSGTREEPAAAPAPIEAAPSAQGKKEAKEPVAMKEEEKPEEEKKIMTPADLFGGEVEHTFPSGRSH